MGVYMKENGQLKKGAGLYKVSVPVGLADIYSTEEKKVGLWIDNKPLYKKSIVLEDVTVPASGRAIISIDPYIANIDNVVNCELVLIDGSTNITIPAFQVATMSQYGVVYYFNKADGLVISGGSQIGASYVRDFVATLQYTKTTDNVTVSTYAPIVPMNIASKYSEDEKVVGEWIDHKPLYQKGYIFTSSLEISYSSFTNTTIDASDMDMIVNAIGYNEDGTCYGALLADPTRSSHTLVGLLTPRNGANANVKYLILQYTKTTDTAGTGLYSDDEATLGMLGDVDLENLADGDRLICDSGKWKNGGGIETTEHVIGTYKGKTLYGAILTGTDNFTNVIVSNQLYYGNVSVSVSDIDELFVDIGHSYYEISGTPTQRRGFIGGVVNDNTAITMITLYSRSSVSYSIAIEYTKSSS